MAAGDLLLCRPTPPHYPRADDRIHGRFAELLQEVKWILKMVKNAHHKNQLVCFAQPELRIEIHFLDANPRARRVSK